MAGHSGRDLTVDFNSTTLVGVKNKSVKINNEAVDVTTDDDTGFRTLLAAPGVQSLDIDVSGVTSDEVLAAEVMSGAGNFTLKSVTINLPTGNGTVTGNFFVSSLDLNGESDGAVEFSASLQSSGAFTYTASA